MSLCIASCVDSVEGFNAIVVSKNIWHIILKIMTRKYLLRISSSVVDRK